ncbi:hypothetical protein BDP67DRAFT_499243 [Colletotrichum lupini]|nr:hypothetical protein BDP67DRAFT_499243 [Colletotrichum lupini]
MPAGTTIAASFCCKAPGCARTYSRKCNLNRHIKSKHGVHVQMPCGIIRQDHTSNSRRHQSRCPVCRATLSLLPLDATLNELDEFDLFFDTA